MNLDINVEVNPLDFADSLIPEQAAELIKAIDKAQACWNFTHETCKYFLEQMKLLIEEDPVEGVAWINELKEILNAT